MSRGDQYIPASTGGGGEICFPDYVHPELMEYAQTAIIAPLNGVCICTGAVFDIVTDSEAGVTVSINPDNTHNIEVTLDAFPAGEWSYQYTMTCPGGSPLTATVSGKANATPVSFTFALLNAPVANFAQIVTEFGSPYDVDWGDGDTQLGLASGTGTGNHAYSPNFTGNVTVTIPVFDNIVTLHTGDTSWNIKTADLPRSIKNLKNTGNGDKSYGDVGDFPDVDDLFWIGQNTFSGDVDGLFKGMTQLQIGGFASIFGNAWPTDLTKMIVTCSNSTAVVNAATSPQGLITYQATGGTLTDGDIDDFSKDTTSFNAADNDITGLWANIPPDMVTLILNDGEQISGSVVSQTLASLIRLEITGNRNGGNALSGTVNDFNTFSPSATDINIYGSNVIGGDAEDIGPNVNDFRIHGLHTITKANALWTGDLTMTVFELLGVGMAEAEVDNMLVALSLVTNWGGFPQTVDLSGNNAPPSAVGTAAIVTILANGCNGVTTN